METLRQDLRHAVRRLARSPGFTLAAVVTLALGIGATTAIFSVVDGVLLRPLSYKDPDRIVLVWERFAARHQDRNVVNPGNYLDWRDRASSFTDLAAFTWTAETFTGGKPEIVQGRAVTPNFFRTLGASPELGRVFSPAEAAPGGPHVIVLSDGLWRQRFGGDSSVIGRPVPVAGGSAIVLGVMPPAFRPMPWGTEQYWAPFRLDPNDRTRQGRYAMVVGRLRPGVTAAEAQAQMDVITRSLAQEYPDFDTGWSSNVVTLTEQVVGASRRALLVVLGAVTLVLLIATANVGNLMLVRVETRHHELALRTALGASRVRLARQWLVESALVALAGGGAGVLLARWGVDLLGATAPPGIPRLAEVAVDVRVLGVAAAVSLLVGLGAGLPAALGIAARDLAPSLRAGTGRTTADRATRRWRNGMIVAQVSLALVLLTGAGLLVRSLQRLSTIDPGFQPTGVMTAGIDLPGATYADGARQAAFFGQLTDRIRSLPGVSGVGVISFIPLAGPGAATRFTIVGRPAPAPGEWTSADIRIVDPGYFGAMRIPVLRGRGFTTADGPETPPVVIINQAMARQFWPGGDPLGGRLQVSWTHPDAQPAIIGVVGDVHASTLDADVHPMIYYVETQEPTGSMTLVVRHRVDPGALVSSMRRAVGDLDRNVPLTDVASMPTLVSRSVADRRYPMLLLSGFALLAVALAAVGLYGLLSYTVTRRSHEIGVRVALGASRGDVLRMVLTDGARVTLVGIAIGAIAAVLSASALGHLLYGVGPADPLTYVAVAGLLTVVSLVASYIPASRATGVDPVVALRTE
jgi:putative ABC transport system permease protein